MFYMAGEKAYFALFKSTVKGFAPFFSEALLKYARCAACNQRIEILEKACGCSEEYSDELQETWFSMFRAALDNKEFEKQYGKDFPGWLGFYYVLKSECDDFVFPAFQKHLRKTVYAPKAHKLRKKRIEKSEVHYTKEQVLWLERRQNLECYYCGVSIKEEYHVDHLLPLGIGGDNGFMNIVLACKSCNLSKHAKPETQFWREIKKKLPDELYRQKRADAKKLTNSKKIRLIEESAISPIKNK